MSIRRLFSKADPEDESKGDEADKAEKGSVTSGDVKNAPASGAKGSTGKNGASQPAQGRGASDPSKPSDSNEKTPNQRTKEDLPSKPQDFQIRVKILEARQLTGSNVSPICRVRCFDQTKQTHIQKSTTSPHWGELFFFNLNKLPSELFQEFITFEVFNSQRLRSDALIGSYKVDIGMMYDEPDHSLLHKWLLLSDPEDLMAGTKGYLKICASVLASGDTAPSYSAAKTDDDNEDIETNLLRPAGILMRPATFELKVFRAEDLPRMDSNTLANIKQFFGSDEKKEFVDPFFIFGFAGNEVESKIVQSCDHPEWNEKLRIGLQFPSMCEKLRFQVLDWDRMSGNDSIGVHNLYTWSISRPGGDATSDESGFLPMFGPCFVNFYGAPREFSDMPTDYDDLNLGKGEGVAFRGRVLLELRTLLGDLPTKSVDNLLDDELSKVQKYMRRRHYKLHAAFLNASMISEVDSSIEFEISIGNYGNKLDETTPDCISTTQPTNPVFDGCFYYFLPWGDNKPCVAIDCHWEDISFRLGALNLILSIINRLETNIATIHKCQKSNLSHLDLTVELHSLLDQLIKDCQKPFPQILDNFHMMNDLDRNMRSYRSKEMKRIAEEAGLLRHSEADINIDHALQEIDGYLKTLQGLAIEPQNSMPDVLIWMISGSKRIAYYRCPAHLVLWSDNPDYRGKFCGKLESIFLKYPGSKAEKEGRHEVPALIRVKIWLGLAKEEANWTHMHTEGDFAVFAETYENQYSILGRWVSKGLIGRPKWSDIQGELCLYKENFIPPAGWKWDGEWYISPELSLMYDKDAGRSEFLEDLYETQSRIPGTNWGPSTCPWATLNGDPSPPPAEVEVPAGWKWHGYWEIDLNRAVDEYGWEYTVEATFGYGPVEKNYHVTRRRRWVRSRLLVQAEASEEEKKKKDAVLAEGWEYAPVFTMKFHLVEGKLDLVRRRRWLRKMDTVDLHDQNDIIPPCLFRLPGDDAERPLTTAPRMFLVCNRKEEKLITREAILTTPRDYQLRAYIYQGRDLAAADSNGLSDPFARVTFLNQSLVTERLEKTVCPTWDQTLIFRKLEIHGDPATVLEDPPEIVIEVFDYDTFGTAEFLGRTTARPMVKLNSSSQEKPRLSWLELSRCGKPSGEVLVAFELLLIDDQELPFDPPMREEVFSVPSGVRPEMVRTAIEALCWGVRNMRRYQFLTVTSPNIEIEVGEQTLQTKIIKNTNQNPNFDDNILFFDIMLPREEMYAPPLTIRCRDNRQFGRKPQVGVNVVKSLEIFKLKPQHQSEESDQQHQDMDVNHFSHTLRSESCRSIKSLIVEDEIDWWSKFYASLGETDKCKQYIEKGYDTFQVYDNELEKVGEFEGFKDFCHTFTLTRGKAIDDEESNIAGEFKGTFRVYELPDDPSIPLPPRVLTNLPHSKPVECVIRVYVVQCTDLQPSDPNGLSDPYVIIKVGKTTLDNRDEYKPNTLNPVFGRMFELKALIPLDNEMTVCIMDYDLLSSDDVIGETVIDLENRLLTKHRATVGLPLTYCISGSNQWRDSKKPSELLKSFCMKYLNCSPVYEGPKIQVGSRNYRISMFETKPITHPHLGEETERLSLHVLRALSFSHHVPLVPEHVEIRPLYNSLQPDIEQGRIQMWVDIFPTELGPPGPPIDIKPRQAKQYELRMVIWNTVDVVLDETSITGEQMSDIYVKGWISGIDEKQETDVHYRSLDGEGNFNWRFVFPFHYIPAEECLVVRKKEHFWSLDETETRLPPTLILQIWDNDKLSGDDFLGSVELNLCCLPRPAKKSSDCTLDQLSLSGTDDHNGSPVQRVSLFDQRKMNGFWPCYRDENGIPELTGKIEMEIELITAGEAVEKPAGKARDEPNLNPHLEPPKRPETSFLWFTSPFKTLKLILWKRFKWHIITGFLIVLLVIFVILFIYSLPGMALKMIFGG